MPTFNEYLLLESGGFLLQEDGARIIIGTFTIPDAGKAGPEVQIQVQSVPGLQSNAGELFINEVITVPQPHARLEIYAVNGNTTINVPITATVITIVPPVDNQQDLTLKGVNGDTGIPLNPTEPTVLSISPLLTSFVLSTSGPTVLQVTFC